MMLMRVHYWSDALARLTHSWNITEENAKIADSDVW